MGSLTIGEVAKRAGINRETLRYYERRGILDEPARRPSGYREYGEETVRLVRFIKRAQELGFTLKEIEELIELRRPARSRANVRRVAEAKVREIDQKIRRLSAMRQALGDLIDACCQDRGASPKCPIIDALSEEVETES